jgi:hypothetical protein
MSFWAGFFAGVIATCVFSIAVSIAVLWPHRRAAECRAAARERFNARSREMEAERSCPEYPTVQFTHVTSIGNHVRGGNG